MAISGKIKAVVQGIAIFLILGLDLARSLEVGPAAAHFGHLCFWSMTVGTVVTGRVDRGHVKIGDPIEIVGLRETRSTVCTGVEMFHKSLDEGMAGDNLGLLLRGIERDDVERGQVLAKPGSITPHRKFLAEVYVLKKEEGGRHKAFFSGYRPQFYIRTMDVTGDITLPEGVEMVMPGDNVNLTVELIVSVALEMGSKFAIREGGLTVGAGVITKIIE